MRTRKNILEDTDILEEVTIQEEVTTQEETAILEETAYVSIVERMVLSDEEKEDRSFALVRCMAAMEHAIRQAIKINNWNLACIKGLETQHVNRAVKNEPSGSRQVIKATLSCARKAFRTFVLESMHNRAAQGRISAGYSLKTRTNAKYEVMSRWKEKGYRHLIVHAAKKLKEPLNKPSAAAGTNRSLMER